MIRKLSADFIFPSTSLPIKNGILVVDEEQKILDVAEAGKYAADEIEMFSGILCPGFVNAHCHLELSFMKNQLPEKTGLVGFIRNLLALRAKEHTNIFSAIDDADDEMFHSGIVAVGDISNATDSFARKSKSKIYYQTFVECFGFVEEKAADNFSISEKVFDEATKLNLAASIVPHAPYSVPPALMKKIFSFEKNNPFVFSFHNQETQAEDDYFRKGTGEFVELLKHFDLLKHQMQVSGKSSLQSVLDFFPSEKNLLLVHNTTTSQEDFDFANSFHKNLWWCTCPNANLFIENRLPDYDVLLQKPERLCIGTDSLASNHQLSVLEELKTISKNRNDISLEILLRAATINGAEFLQIENRFGSFDVGKTPGINLIKNIDSEKIQLTAESVVQKVL